MHGSDWKALTSAHYMAIHVEAKYRGAKHAIPVTNCINQLNGKRRLVCLRRRFVIFYALHSKQAPRHHNPSEKCEGRFAMYCIFLPRAAARADKTCSCNSVSCQSSQQPTKLPPRQLVPLCHYPVSSFRCSRVCDKISSQTISMCSERNNRLWNTSRNNINDLQDMHRAKQTN